MLVKSDLQENKKNYQLFNNIPEKIPRHALPVSHIEKGNDTIS